MEMGAEPVDPGAELESDHTTDRISARNRRIEIIAGERRQRWSIEEKLRIVAETEEVGAHVTEVAARHGVYPGLLFTWRRQVQIPMEAVQAF